MAETFTLRATDLWSKWGFRDGDIFDDFLFDNGFSGIRTGEDDLCFSHEVLVRCVQRHLMPSLPVAIAVDTVFTCHNPIRVSSYFDDDAELEIDAAPDVAVEITDEQVTAIAREIKAEIEAKNG